MFLGTILVFSYIIRIAEIEQFRVVGDSLFDSYFTSIYFTSVTLSTVGYGDISPGTKLGQLLTIMFAMWSTLLLSVVVSALMSVFDLKDDEKQSQAHVNLNRKAATAIQKAFKFYIAKKKLYILRNAKPKTMDDVKIMLAEKIREKMNLTSESLFWTYINRNKKNQEA